MKFHNMIDRLNRAPQGFVNTSDVMLNVGRDDLAPLLSELMNNLNEGEDDICSVPLKLVISEAKGVAKEKRLSFILDKERWKDINSL